MIYNLFSSSFYNAVSVLLTNKLVQNISRCNPSVVFVSNHCSPTIFLYPHFLVLQLSSISNQSINLRYLYLLCLIYFFIISMFIYYCFNPRGILIYLFQRFSSWLKQNVQMLFICFLLTYSLLSMFAARV